jgi:hypothetical protein
MTKEYEMLGFGFMPKDNEHHFHVIIDAAPKGNVLITEQFNYTENDDKRKIDLKLGRFDSHLKCVMPKVRWNLFAEALQNELNRRLKQHGFRSAKWKNGDNYVSRLLGKEMMVLVWAMEEADPGLAEAAVKNWLGLRPEERWWLFTMTNAATGHATNDRNKGWRKALRFALTENPVDVRKIPKDISPLFGEEI